MIFKTSFLNHLRSLRQDEKGGLAITMGLLIVPVLLTIGLSIDFLRVTNTRAKAAEALDIALLMTAQQYSYDHSIDINAVAQTNLNANWGSSAISTPTVTATVGANNVITGTISTQMPTSFMRLTGINHLDININAEVSANTKDLELVLVLDNTGSMGNPDSSGTDKIVTLKAAATRLVNTVMPTNGVANQVKVGIVPFSAYVNVGVSNAGQPWLNVPADWSHCRDVLVHPNQCTGGSGGTTTTCYDDEGASYQCTTGGTPLSCPPSAYENQCHPHHWSGCVGSRTGGLDLLDSTYSTKVPGVLSNYDETDEYVQCPKAITPLTETKATLLTAIDDMDTDGNTYIPGGLIWGLRTLSENAPFDQGAPASNTNIQKIMVLMTDGKNTLGPVHPYHNTSQVNLANGLTTTACQNIKNAGITLYTVAFDVTDIPTKTMLRNCASNPTQFYDATDADSLNSAFRDITIKLINLRISK